MSRRPWRIEILPKRDSHGFGIYDSHLRRLHRCPTLFPRETFPFLRLLLHSGHPKERARIRNGWKVCTRGLCFARSAHACIGATTAASPFIIFSFSPLQFLLGVPTPPAGSIQLVFLIANSSASLSETPGAGLNYFVVEQIGKGIVRVACNAVTEGRFVSSTCAILVCVMSRWFEKNFPVLSRPRCCPRNGKRAARFRRAGMIVAGLE